MNKVGRPKLKGKERKEVFPMRFSKDELNDFRFAANGKPLREWMRETLMFRINGETDLPKPFKTISGFGQDGSYEVRSYDTGAEVRIVGYDDNGLRVTPIYTVTKMSGFDGAPSVGELVWNEIKRRFMPHIPRVEPTKEELAAIRKKRDADAVQADIGKALLDEAEEHAARKKHRAAISKTKT